MRENFLLMFLLHLSSACAPPVGEPKPNAPMSHDQNCTPRMLLAKIIRLLLLSLPDRLTQNHRGCINDIQ